MRTWFSRPSHEWHLEATPVAIALPVAGACGLTWLPSALDPVERTADLATLLAADRCPVCQDVYLRGLTEA